MSSQTSSLPVIPSVLADDGSCSSVELNRSDPESWYFAKERLENTPSRRSGIDPDKELTYRQQSANYIQDIGQKLQVNQLCINTAIVYMHRFYMFHSFTQFHRNAISAASIFLAAKVEEQPRKLEHVIKMAHYCLHRDHQVQIDVKSEQYLEQSAELVMNENILLQTLGFDVAIDHPHTHVVKCCQLVRASKDLAQTSYFMATNSLHLTTMCLQYKPTVVACVCIHLACKWSSWEIPRSKEGKDWFWYVDDTVTSELLEKLTTDFLQIFNKSPSRLKKKIISLNNAATSSGLSLTNAPYHGFDSSPGQNHNTKSRSPSPKRQGSQKPSSSQPGVPGKMKMHGMPMPHHPMKLPYPPGPGAPSATKHSSHPHPPHGHSSSHASAKPHPGMSSNSSIKDPLHPHHAQHTKNPYPPHGHGHPGVHGQYPHGSRSGMQSTGSNQSHHGLGVHSKPPIPGSTSSSSHPYSSSSSSSSSLKNMQSHNPSKPPHMPPGGSSKIPMNQVPGAVKNPNQPMFHSSQSHLKKPYEPRPEFGMKREAPNPSSTHHSQNHARPHDKLVDGRHHTSGSNLPETPHGSTQVPGNTRGSSHHMFLGQDAERPSGNSTSNPKMAYMDSRSMENSSDVNRHRNNIQSSDAKRGMSHSGPAATNGNNNDSVGSLGTAGGSAAGAGDSHVPSKNTFRQPSSLLSGSTFGQNSQSDVGANKFHNDSFGGEFGSYGSNSSILSIEDRRKRRHEAMSMTNSSSTSATKRPRTDAYSTSVPLSTTSLFSPEESSDSSKRLPPSSQFSPSPIEGTQSSYSKVPDRSHHGNAYSGTSEGISFGSSASADIKPDIRRVTPSVEFQAPDLLQPISDVKIEPLLSSGGGSNNAPRAASLFSPEFTPSNIIPDINISPPPSSTEIHKRDVFSNIKQESSEINHQSSSGFSESGSHVSFTGRLSNSPKREDMKDDDDSHGSKKSKKKDKKHKHKHKEEKEKKHKKDKHKDKEKEKDKDKKAKHRSKHGSSSAPVEVSNDMSSTKLKIKIGSGRDESKGSSTQQPSSARHSSSKSNSSSSSATNHSTSVSAPLASLKVKISSKGRVNSLDDEIKHGSPADESTPCCPGFGPCLTCNRDTSQDQYRFFSSAPSQGLTMKIAKSKESSKTSKDSSSSSSRESKKSKDKTSKTSSSSSSTSSTSYGNPLILSSSRLPSMPGNHVHKNGMEKPSKKKDKSASIL